MASCVFKNYGMPLRSFLKTSVCFKEPPLSQAYGQAKSMTTAWHACLMAANWEVGGLLEIHFLEGWRTVAPTSTKFTVAGILECSQPECQPAWAQVQTTRDIAWP